MNMTAYYIHIPQPLYLTKILICESIFNNFQLNRTLEVNGGITSSSTKHKIAPPEDVIPVYLKLSQPEHAERDPEQPESLTLG